MPKVKCEDCQHWLYSHTQQKKDSKYMFSFSFAYKKVKKGTCLSDEAGKATSGYTGMASGHKMSRLGGTLRHCKFFKPKESEKDV